jgi:hypothetical protein
MDCSVNFFRVLRKKLGRVAAWGDFSDEHALKPLYWLHWPEGTSEAYVPMPNSRALDSWVCFTDVIDILTES